jgi:hypothetical protein
MNGKPIPLKVRMMGDSAQVEADAEELIAALTSEFELVEQSKPYPCRPPDQDQSRVYLTFLRRVKP